MRHLVACSIWNKPETTHLILSGIDLGYNKEDTTILLIFDGCTDKTLDNFNIIKEKMFTDWDIRYIINSEEKYEWYNTVIMQQYALKNDYDVLSVYQDDMIILGSGTIQQDVEKIIKEQENIGVIGGRAGFNVRYIGGFGSYWTNPQDNISTILDTGEYSSVLFVNNGPIFYPKETLEKVGFFDLGYIFFCAEEDYCFRCRDVGLTNFILGTEMAHMKIGRVTASKIYDGEISRRDYQRLKMKGYL